jgi:hypothetical protein
VKPAIFLVLACLAACKPSQAVEVKPSAAGRPSQVEVASTIPGIRLARIAQLPANRDHAPLDEYCSYHVVEKLTSAGARLAAQRGWHVTSEAKLGKYDAVVLVGGMDPATSGMCFKRDSNLAIFDGNRLQVLAYTAPNSKIIIGAAEQIDANRFRLNDGIPSSPYADVVLRDGISIEQVAAIDTVCGGAARVPNIFDSDIKRARKKLLAYGWQPVRASERSDFWSVEQELYAQGVIEIQSCSGTGLGFCNFDYRHRKGFQLGVTSMGERKKIVWNYGVDCSPSKRR